MRELPLPDLGEPDHRSPLRYLMWLVRGQIRPLAGGVALGIIYTLSQAVTPAVIGRAIDEGVLAKNTTALVTWSGVLLSLGLLQAVSGVTRHRFDVFNWLAAAYRTVQVVDRQVTRLGVTLLNRLSTGEVVSVGVADVAHIGGAMEAVGSGTGAVVSVIVVTAILLMTSPPLGLVVVIGVPVILALTAPVLRPLHRRQHRQRELSGDLNARATDIVAGLRILRGIGGEEAFGARYREQSQRVRWAGVDVARAESMLAGAEVLLPGLLIALVTWLGARFAVAGSISVGELVAFYGYAVFLIQPVRTIGRMADRITKAHVAAGRVTRILSMRPQLPCAGSRIPPGGAELIDAESGLVVRPGEFIAIAAADPAQARSICDRLGYYTEGAVTYGGIPLGEIADLRRRILVAVNEDTLFSGPLREVLRPRADADLRAALHAACADDLIDAVGPDTHVAEAGREFSGGQRQRLQLARALLADPDVLILVEPTNAVDAHTEARIAERLGKARNGPWTGACTGAWTGGGPRGGAGRATVVCTGSPLILDQVDRVVYVQDGVVAAEGTHRELLRTHPGYAAAVTREPDR